MGSPILGTTLDGRLRRAEIGTDRKRDRYIKQQNTQTTNRKPKKNGSVFCLLSCALPYSEIEGPFSGTTLDGFGSGSRYLLHQRLKGRPIFATFPRERGGSVPHSAQMVFLMLGGVQE